MVYIYIISQQNNKYYIGKTKDPQFRLLTHFKTGGCAWTKKYKPILIIGLFPDCDEFDEDKYTIKYMKKHGIDNVRGGSFCQIILDKDTKKCVERMICGASDGCHFCGKKGHFITDCYSKKNKDKYKTKNKEFLEASKNYESADEVEFEDEEITYENLEDMLEDEDDGVYTFDDEKYLWCDGELFEESSRKTPKQLRKYLDMNDMFDAVNYNWRPFQQTNKKSTKKSTCHKCGRGGHYANKCYAARHVKGYAI